MAGILGQRIKEFALFILMVFVFTWRLNGQEIIHFDARYYLYALEMWRHGFTWFPTMYLEPDPGYPVAGTWLIYVTACLVNGLSKFSAVLPTAVAASLTTVFTYKLGQLIDKRLGYFAVCMLVTTFAFLHGARTIAPEMYTALFTVLSVYLLHSAKVKRACYRTWLVYPAFLLSFLFTGPYGLIVPLLAVSIYYLVEKSYRQFLITLFVSTGLLMVATYSLLCLANYVGGDAFMQAVWREQVLGGFNYGYLSICFYFFNSFFSYALTYPFALLVSAGIYLVYRRQGLDAKNMLIYLQLIAWFLLLLVAISLPGHRNIRYLLPIAPALALLVAYLWHDEPKQRFLQNLGLLAVWLYLFLPTVLFAMTLYIWSVAEANNLPTKLGYMPIGIFFSLMQVATLYFYYADEKDRRQQLSWVALCAAFCFVIMNNFLFEPLSQHAERAREFVESIEDLRQQKNSGLVFYQANPKGMPARYILNMPNEKKPVFIDQLSALKKLKRNNFVITQQASFENLPRAMKSYFQIIANGKIGFSRVVVFKRK